jgi:hypothetical protein
VPVFWLVVDAIGPVLLVASAVAKERLFVVWSLVDERPPVLEVPTVDDM